MEFKFLLGLGLITLTLIGTLIFFGRKLSKRVQKQSPDSVLTMTITRTGYALIGCMVGFWIFCLFVKDLMPESNLGQFLNTTDGIITVFIGSYLFFVVVAILFNKIGSPIAKMGGNGT